MGVFDLISIPSAPRGVYQIEVSFEVDANGILREDEGTGKAEKITINNCQDLLVASQKIQHIVKETGKIAEEDRLVKWKIDCRKTGVRIVYIFTPKRLQLEAMIRRATLVLKTITRKIPWLLRVAVISLLALREKKLASKRYMALIPGVNGSR